MHATTQRILLALTLAGCGGNAAPIDAGPLDAGMDAGALDAGAATDAGEPDAGIPNLTIDAERARLSARVVWEHFDETSCVIVEGCVVAPGWRRLLRFDTFTPNVGTADFRMGPPADHPDLFEYSECHMHYHYNGYANYEVRSGDAVVATGHKQAFCLMDSEQVVDEPGVARAPQYDCDNQGISRGWGDNYYAALDCQWVDVTDLAPGEYTLRLTVNGARTIPESSYDDNVVDVPVTVPDDATLDPTLACDRTLDGPRDCGWAVAGSFDCTPGTMMRVGCGAACGLGSCGADDDAIMRVCAGETACASRDALASGDDGCGDTYCPLTTFTCPEGGRYTVMTAPYLTTDTVSCVPAAAPVM